MSNERSNVGAVWYRETTGGKKWLSMVIDGNNYVAFKARSKRNENSPDMYVFPARERSENVEGNEPF